MSKVRPDKPKAAYDIVEIGKSQFALRRDGVAMRSPCGQDMIVPTRSLAESMAREWRAQEPCKTDLASMPMTRLAISALDGPSASREATESTLLAVAQSDTLLHRAPPHEPLAARQAQVWQPLLDWFAEQFEAKLVASAGIMPIPQCDETLRTVNAALAGLNPFALAGIDLLCRATGSLVLAMALAEGRLDAKRTFEAAELESLCQIERWGEDSEARAKLDSVRNDIEQCEKWFDLLRETARDQPNGLLRQSNRLETERS